MKELVIKKLLINRRTIHQFKKVKVDDSLVKEALEVGTYVPNHKLTFPWRFTILGPEVTGKIADLSVALKQEEEQKEFSSAMQEAIKQKLTNPSHIVVLRQHLCHDAFTEKEDYASMACAVQNISLFLWNYGVGCKWSTGKITRASQTYELLNIDEREEEIVGFLSIGIPEKIPPLKARPAIDDLISKTL